MNLIPKQVYSPWPTYFGKEASAFTKRMVEGKQVYLEYEEGYPGSVLLDYHHDLVALGLLSEILVGSF